MRLYGDGDKEERLKMSDGKKRKIVWISKLKVACDQGYIANWSEEHFLVESDMLTLRQLFKLIDNMAYEVNGSGYQERCQKSQSLVL